MKKQFALKFVGVLGLFAITAPAAFPGGGGRVGNGKKADETQTAPSTTETAPAPAATPQPTPDKAAKPSS